MLAVFVTMISVIFSPLVVTVVGWLYNLVSPAPPLPDMILQ